MNYLDKLTLSQLKARVANTLPKNRFVHTEGVCETAKQLANRFGVDEEAAQIAALLHDIAKYESEDDMKKHLQAQALTSYLAYSSLVWHAPVGAIIARETYGIEDEDILNAIQYHTTGRANMSELEKVIYLADYIEPNRRQPGVEEIRTLCTLSLDQALAETLKRTVTYLQRDPEAIIHPDTLAARDYYN